MEDNLQDLSVILSSMSPKVDNVRKIRQKKINKLALKTSLRRSSIYDKLPHTAHNNVIISGSDTTETGSTSSGTSITNSETKTNVRENPSKFDEINKWVAKVNIEHDEVDTSNTTTFNEISTIIPDHKKIKRSNNTSCNHFAVNSTFIDSGNCIRFHEMFQKKKMESPDCSIEENQEEVKHNSDLENRKIEKKITPDGKNNDSVIIINDSYEEIQNFETPIKTQNVINEHEKLLDELYGNSWRANKEHVLSFSEKRQKKEVNIKKDILPHTERKPKPSITHKNPYLFNEITKSQNLLRSVHCTRVMKMTESSPWATKFKDICDTESSTEDLITESPLKCKMKLTFSICDSDDADFLELNNVQSNCDKFINKTPRGVKRVDYKKENEQNKTTIGKPTEKDSLISCNLQIDNENHISSEVQDESDLKNNDFYDNMLENKETLEERKKDFKSSNLSFDDIVKSLEDMLRNSIVSNKRNGEIYKDLNGKKTDSYSSIPQERSDDVKNNKATKHVPKSNENEVQKEEKKHKTKLFEGLLLPENKLKNILSIERKTIAPEVNKTKKVTKKNTNVKKNDIQSINTESKRSRSKKNVKYFNTSSSDSDSSEESVYIDQKQGRSKIEGPLSFLASLSGSAPVDKCDASARIFRSTYKTSKEELAKKLFYLYNEKVFGNSIPDDTLIEWSDKMRGTAGFCYCRKITRGTGVVERKARIVLATKILDSADRLRDTLIHEMCHAATWIVNQISDGHGSYWKAWAAKAMKVFPELPPIKRCHDYAINTKYTYKCCNCGYSIGRHSKSLDVERKRCGYCYGKFEIFINKTTKGGIKAMTPATPKRQPTGFALFVKENYSGVKKENKNHAEVMKILSKKFSEFKST